MKDPVFKRLQQFQPTPKRGRHGDREATANRDREKVASRSAKQNRETFSEFIF